VVTIRSTDKRTGRSERVNVIPPHVAKPCSRRNYAQTKLINQGYYKNWQQSADARSAYQA